jgi:hypothetical protein
MGIIDQHKCTDYHYFIYYSGFYMFRHPYAILKNVLCTSELLERQKYEIRSYVVCAQLDNITHDTTTTSAHSPQLNNITHDTTTTSAHSPQLNNITHDTITTSAHRPPTFTVHDHNITISASQVTQKDTERSLKMAYECRNM